MVSEAILGAVIGGGFAVVGSIITATINYFRTSRRLEEENERRHAEFYLNKKVDALAEVYTNLAKCDNVLSTALQDTSSYSWFRVQDEIYPEIRSLQRSISISSIFLTSEQDRNLHQTVEKYKSIANEIAIRDAYSENVAGQLMDATNHARNTLASEINEPIRRFEGEEKQSVKDEVNEDDPQELYPSDNSEREILAKERERIRDVLRITEDGDIELLIQKMHIDGTALFYLIGQRYAYESGLVDSIGLTKKELVPIVSDSEAATDVFLGKADEYLTKKGDVYYVATSDLNSAIDWATNYIRADKREELEV